MSLEKVLFSPITHCAVLIVVLALLLTAAIWGLRRFRDYIDDDLTAREELLPDYREMYEQGVISDAEYRTIKNRLHAGKRRE